jgi:hypothetical protein
MSRAIIALCMLLAFAGTAEARGGYSGKASGEHVKSASSGFHRNANDPKESPL